MMGAGEGAPPRPPAFVLSLSLMSMTMAGSTYWAPSLAAAIAGPLALAPSATAVFAASVNAGYIFCVFSGILHGRLGPRRTAMVGSAGLCATYLAIAVVVLVKPAFPMLFLAPLAVAISMTSYCIYGATQTSAVAAFPLERRGSINGLMSSVYALSSGLIGGIEAGFFPAVSAAKTGVAGGPVVHLLVCVATLALIPFACAVLAFPLAVTSKRPTSVARSASRNEYSAVASEDDPGASTANPSIADELVAVGSDHAIRTGYCVTVLLALALQLCAAVDWVGGVQLGSVRAELFLAWIVVGLLSLFALPALWSSRAGDVQSDVVPPETSVGTAETPITYSLENSECSEEPLSLRELVVGHRFVFLFTTLSILAGCGGLTLVNTSTGLVASRMIPNEFTAQAAPTSVVTTETISRGVRAVVVLFSALGVAGRLIGGAITDLPAREGLLCSGMSMVAWRYALLQAVAVLLFANMLLCAFARSWWLLLSAGSIGFCHGLFFSIAPAFSMDLFGVASFARDFAVAGIGAGVGACTLAVVSSLVVRRRRDAGAWADVSASLEDTSTTRHCVGVACLAPSYLLCAGLIALFLVYSVSARRRLLALQ